MMPSTEITDHTVNYDVALQNAENRVFHLLHSLEWQLHSEKKTGSIWSMKCNVMDNYIFRYEGRIPNRSCAEVSAMIHPQGLHRNKWDSQSAGTSLVEAISHDTSVILHKTKGRMMGLISPRETVDLCRFAYDPVDGSRSVVMVSVDNEKSPKTAGVVRGQTYPTLLMINPLGDGSKITAIIQAEMFLQGIPQSVVDTLIPKGIATFFEDLIKYASKEDNKVSLNHNLAGWCGAQLEN
uniref:START domain-containing protein n=2 Tax=Caenorhabditis japonica TaxID=281687 RepID=A0A8R1HKI7_CAEJA